MLRSDPGKQQVWRNGQVEALELESGAFEVRLPTEAEWEKAARGTGGWKYPWGEEFDAGLCNVEETGIGKTSTVGIFPAGTSPYGALDMVGNVWVWCQSLVAPYPYHTDDGRENLGARGLRILRGGAWNDLPHEARCAFRNRPWIRDRGYDIGFRIILSPAFPS